MPKPVNDPAWYLIYITLTLMVCGAFYALVISDFPQANRELALMIIGAAVAKWGDAIAYRINSTKGSADKNALLFGTLPVSQGAETITEVVRPPASGSTS